MSVKIETVQPPSFDHEPDVVLATQRLSDLPADLLKLPLLKDLLSEDFVFYYSDGGENWLSFRGALARLAYENHADWPIKILRWFLSGPAEAALWRDPKDGKLSHAMFVIDESGIKQLAQALLKAASNDGQFKTDHVDGRTIYSLSIPNGTEIFFATDEGRLIIFTDKDMRLPIGSQSRTWSERSKAFLGVTDSIGIFGPRLVGAKHIVTMSASFATFGYQKFFSSMQAFRFRFDRDWQAAVLSKGNASKADWTMMPRGAALCVAIPFDREIVAQIVRAGTWIAQTTPVAQACWYPDSKFYAPLISVRGNYTGLLAKPDVLEQAFARMIGSREEILEIPKVAEGVPVPEATIKWLSKLSVRALPASGEQIGFTREVGGRYGPYAAKKSAENKKLGSHHFFRVKVVALKDEIVFSPDDTLVDLALRVHAGNFPSMSSSLSKDVAWPALILAPKEFAILAKKSILESLPESQEAVFRTSVSRYLLPNLDKFGTHPLQAGSLGSINAGWVKMNWTTNASR